MGKKKGKPRAQAAGKPRGAKTDRGSGHRFVRWLEGPWFAVLLIFTVSVALYADTLNHDFVWDDYYLIVENPNVRTLDMSTIHRIFIQDFWQVSGPGGSYYRPLVTLSYHLDFRLFNGHPAGFHLTNVLWNAATCVLVFGCVYLLFGNVLVGSVSALLFATHPIHTEAVAWVSGRPDILATFWTLLALCLYVLARRRRSHSLLFGSLLAFLLALFAKEFAVCVPLLIVLFEIPPMAEIVNQRSRESERPRRGGSFMYPVIYFGVLGVYLVIRQTSVGTAMSTYDAFAPGALGVVALPLSIMAGYVYKVFFPFRLTAEYDAAVPSSFAEAHVIAGALVIALLFWAIWRYRHKPFVVLGVGVFALGLGPVLNVIPIGEISAERFLYFPSFGVVLVLGSIFAAALTSKYPLLVRTRGSRAAQAWRIPKSIAGQLIILLGIIIALFVVRTVSRNADWKNEEVLFTKSAEQEPNNPRALAMFGSIAQRKGDIDTAIRAYEKALSLDPGNPRVGNLLAGLWVQQGRYDEALQLLESALRTAPDDPQLTSNLGALYLEMKRYDEAAQKFQKALALNPNELRAHFNLGLTRLAQGDSVSARPHFERAVLGGPSFNKANYHLATIELSAGNRGRAKEYARRFLVYCDENDPLRERAEAIGRNE